MLLFGREIPTWQLYVSIILGIIAVVLRVSFVRFVFALARKVLGKNSPLLNDLEENLFQPLVYLVLNIWIYVVLYMLELFQFRYVTLINRWLFGIPLLVATVQIQGVISNIIIRRNKWNIDTEVHQFRILLTRGVVAVSSYFFVTVELLYIYLLEFEYTTFIILVLFMVLEVILALASYSTVINFLAGLTLVLAEPFRTNALCRIGNTIGHIEKVSLRSTTLRRYDGSVVYIPNALFLKKSHENLSLRNTTQLTFCFKIHPGVCADIVDTFLFDLESSLAQYAMISTPIDNDTIIEEDEETSQEEDNDVGDDMSAERSTSSNSFTGFQLRTHELPSGRSISHTGSQLRTREAPHGRSISHTGSQRDRQPPHGRVHSANGRVQGFKNFVRQISSRISAEFLTMDSRVTASTSAGSSIEDPIQVILKEMHKVQILLLVEVDDFRSFVEMKSKVENQKIVIFRTLFKD